MENPKLNKFIKYQKLNCLFIKIIHVNDVHSII